MISLKMKMKMEILEEERNRRKKNIIFEIYPVWNTYTEYQLLCGERKSLSFHIICCTLRNCFRLRTAYEVKSDIALDVKIK